MKINHDMTAIRQAINEAGNDVENWMYGDGQSMEALPERLSDIEASLKWALSLCADVREVIKEKKE